MTGLEKAWREAQDEVELRTKRAEEAAKKEEEKDSGFDDEEDKDKPKEEEEKKPEEETTAPAAAVEEEKKEEEKEPGVYAEWTEEALKEKVEQLKEAMDEGQKAYQDQVAVKDTLKKELDELDQLLRHDLHGEHALYGLYRQCFSKQITE